MKMSNGNDQKQGGLKRVQAQEQTQKFDVEISNITVDTEGLGYATATVSVNGKNHGEMQFNHENRGEKLSLDPSEGDAKPMFKAYFGDEYGCLDGREADNSERLMAAINKAAEGTVQQEFDRIYSGAYEAPGVNGVRALTIHEAQALPLDSERRNDAPMTAVGSVCIDHYYSSRRDMHYVEVRNAEFSVVWKIHPGVMAEIKARIAEEDYSDQADAAYHRAWTKSLYSAGCRDEEFLPEGSY